MRQGQALLLGLLAGSLLGCASGQPVRTSTWLDRLLWPAGPAGPDVVQMDIALIERPLGDGYLNQELWVAADEQVVAAEKRAILEDNGFRIGQMGGITPVGLQTLLTSERSCANPRRIRTHAGRPAKVVLGPESALCQFSLHRGGDSSAVTLEKAQVTLEVVPTLTADGRTRLLFVPQVHHGESNLVPRPAADLSGWMLKEERPTERYGELAWEVTLAPNEYVIVGGRYDRLDTLGQQSFLRRDEPNPVQRLLVIRTGRPGRELEGQSLPSLDDDPLPGAGSLARAAALSAFRGSSR
jgi:hypothetical protein